MGATLDGLGSTSYGIIVNNQSASQATSNFTSPPIGGVSITNITLTGFTQAGIFFNNVLGNLPGTIASNITSGTAPASNVEVKNSGDGIILKNSQNVEVSYANVHDNSNSGITLDGSGNINLTSNIANLNGARGAMGYPGGDGGAGYGIYLDNSWNTTLYNNTANYNGGNGVSSAYGIFPNGNGGVGYGIYLDNSWNVSINNNNANFNGGTGGNGPTGPFVMFSTNGGDGGIGYGIYLNNSWNNNISGNIADQNGGNGGNGGTNTLSPGVCKWR